MPSYQAIFGHGPMGLGLASTDHGICVDHSVGSAAQQGIAIGDQLLGVNGSPLTSIMHDPSSVDELQQVMSQMLRPIQIDFKRATESAFEATPLSASRRKFQITFGAKPLGITVMPMTHEGKDGCYIAGSKRSDVDIGSVILAIDLQDVTGPEWSSDAVMRKLQQSEPPVVMTFAEELDGVKRQAVCSAIKLAKMQSPTKRGASHNPTSVVPGQVAYIPYDTGLWRVNLGSGGACHCINQEDWSYVRGIVGHLGYLYMLGDFVGLCKVDPLTGTHTVLNGGDQNNQWPDMRSMALLDGYVYVPYASGMWRIDIVDGSFEHINDRDWSCVRAIVADPAEQSLYMLGDFLGLCKMNARGGSYLVLGTGDTNHWWGDLSTMALIGRYIFVPYSTGVWAMDSTDGTYTRVNSQDWSAVRSIVPAASNDGEDNEPPRSIGLPQQSFLSPANSHARSHSLRRIYLLGDFEGVRGMDVVTGETVSVHPPQGVTAAAGGLGTMRWTKMRAQGVAQMEGSSSSSSSMPGTIMSTIRKRASSDIDSVNSSTYDDDGRGSIAGSEPGRADVWTGRSDVGTNPLVLLGGSGALCEVDVALDEKGGLGIILCEKEAQEEEDEEDEQPRGGRSSWARTAMSWRRRVSGGRRGRERNTGASQMVLEIDTAPDALRRAVVVCRSQHTQGGLMHRSAEFSGLLRPRDVLVKLDNVDVRGLDAEGLAEVMKRRVEREGTEGTVRLVVERRQASAKPKGGRWCCDGGSAIGVVTMPSSGQQYPMVQLTNDTMRFIDAFARFNDGDLVDGWTERKNEKLGAIGQVTQVHANRTLAIRFADGQEMRFPLEIVEPVEGMEPEASFTPSQLAPRYESDTGNTNGERPTELQRNCEGLAGVFTRMVFGPDQPVEEEGSQGTAKRDEQREEQPQREASKASASNVTRAALADFFTQHGVPEKVVLVDEILAGYAGKHNGLRQDLRAKYGTEPRFDV
jgi:hypothetical protein